ncbi:MAG: hypothetical protein WB770_10345, partial [Acidimicrobiales bacterium]
VRSLEMHVQGPESTPPVEPPAIRNPTTPTLRPPGVLELEELLATHLNTRVRVEMSHNRGKMTIEFAGLEDLERIYRLMIGEPSTNA